MKMFKLFFLSSLLSISAITSYGQDTSSVELDSTTLAEIYASYNQFIDSAEQAMNYIETGTVTIGNSLAEIALPEGYKFLNPEQSAFVLTDLWGNPPQEILGMLFPSESSLMDTTSYAIIISYDESGHIKDEDAADLDYDDLLDQMKEDTEEASEYRISEGYESIELIGWASAPYYDSEAKKLHWAKELKFGESPENTLNYNIRVLGRKGYLELNFIGDMDILQTVQNDMPRILPSVNFKEGNTYFDFDPDLDEVAAYGIGGLIAGKVLAKAGFFALLAKFWKFIALGAVALFAAVKRFLTGKGKDDAATETEA